MRCVWRGDARRQMVVRAVGLNVKRTRWTPKTREAFLDALAAGLTVREACHASGLGRTRLYELRAEDVGFAADWDRAEAEGTEVLEQEARRRAVEGVDEPVFHRGEVVGAVRKYSDTLLIFLLKGRKPEVYRDNVHVTRELDEAAIEALAEKHGVDPGRLKEKLKLLQGGKVA